MPKLVSTLVKLGGALQTLTMEAADEPDEDNMEEIDTNNIISGGRRTRGRQIDFAKAAEELPEEEDDEDDDDDFEAPADEDKMEE
jgi:hypothetical protein